MLALLGVSQGEVVDPKLICNFLIRCLPFFKLLDSILLINDVTKLLI